MYFRLREGAKKTRLFRGHVPYQAQGGGGRPPSCKEMEEPLFIQQNNLVYTM